MAQPPDAAHRATVQRYRTIEELIPSHWSRGTVVANSIRQHYYRTGADRPPLLLLHGFLDGAVTWLRTARALEGDYDVIMVDARGHGRSDGIETGFPQGALTEDAAGLIRALKLGAPGILGHSQGGATGIHVAAAYPDLVRALIVEGWGAEDAASAETEDAAKVDFDSSSGYQAWLSAYLAWLEQLRTQTHAERMISSLSQLPPGAPLPPEDEYVPWVDACYRLDPKLVTHSVTMWAQVAERGRRMAQALEQVVCPVLIMKSELLPHPPSGPRSVREEASDRPNISIVRFVNTGHLIHRDEFDLFIAEVHRFFEGY